ncbi:MAG: hypothetical protein QMC67_07335 [Candidatus Wallbacteria bacterium]
MFDKNTVCKLLIINLCVFLLITLGFYPVYGDNSFFANSSNVSEFKAKIKKDIFYPEDAKQAMISGNIDKNNRNKNDEKLKGQAGTSENTVEVKIIEKKNVLLMDENFRVEGIIKIGERGCAMINSKLWYVGKPQLGYELIKLYDESVEIKTPDGRILKCQLIKEGKIE